MRGEVAPDAAEHVYPFVHKCIFLLLCEIDEFKGRTNQFWHFLSFKAKHILFTMVWNLGFSVKFKGQLIIMKLLNARDEMTKVWWWIGYVTCSFLKKHILRLFRFPAFMFCCILFFLCHNFPSTSKLWYFKYIFFPTCFRCHRIL